MSDIRTSQGSVVALRQPRVGYVPLETRTAPATVCDFGAAMMKLTPQERSVSGLVVQGLTNKETARRLLAEKAVQYHLTRIYSNSGEEV